MKRLAFPFALVLALGAALPAAGQQPPWSGPSVLADPEWRNRFLGSYGVLSGVEPEISEDERVLLPEVIELMDDDPKAAATLLEQRVGPASSAALDFLLGNLHFQNDEQEPAIRYYRSALEKFPDFRRAHKNLGLLLVQRGDFPGALEHLTRAVELGDRDGRNYGLIGHCYVQLEKYLPAEVAYRSAILQQPDVKDWKLGLARSLLAMEHHRDAVALFDEVIEADPEDATAWMLQANAYLGLEQPLAAATNLEAVRMLGKAQSSSLVLLGDIYMNAGMPELARSAYLEVIRGDTGAQQFRTAYRAADLLIRARSFGDAREILASIDERYGKDLSRDEKLDVLTLEARVARGQGREADAARLLESVVRQDGTRGEALLELAAHYQKQASPEKALLMAQRAQNLEGFEYRALLLQAQILVSGKDYARAAELLRRALQLENEPRVARFLASVEQAIQPQ